MTEQLNYEDFIVSNEKFCTFLHRCFRSSVEKIVEEGLESGANIQGTATWQPRDLESAKGLYNSGKDHGDSVVVIQIPREMWEGVRKDVDYRGEEVAHPDIGYMPKGRNFMVKPDFISAWIDRTSNKVSINLHQQ